MSLLSGTGILDGTGILSGRGILFQSGILVPPLVSLDADAAAYIALIEAAGAAPDAAQKTTISDFYVAAKAEGYYTSLKRLYLPIWGAAAANAIDMITGASGTFNGGVTHGAGFVQGNGSTGYFDFGVSPATLGLTTSSAMIGTLKKSASSVIGIPIGSSESTPTNLFIVCINDATLNTANQNAGDSLSEAMSPISGIILNNRTTNTVISRDRRITAGYSTAAGSTTAATLGPPIGNIYALARNNDGAAANHDNAEYGLFVAATGLSQPNSQAFTTHAKNLWESCTGLTLP